MKSLLMFRAVQAALDAADARDILALDWSGGSLAAELDVAARWNASIMASPRCKGEADNKWWKAPTNKQLQEDWLEAKIKAGRD